MVSFITEQISDEDASTIARLISTHARPGMLAVELGTYTGRSALAMLPTIARVNGQLLCVDWFRGNIGVDAEIGPSYRNHDILGTLRQNLKGHAFEDRALVLVSTTQAAARFVAEGSLDALFLDADHRYSAVKADLAAWYPKMKPGGLVFGHDFEAHLSELDPGRVAEHCERDFVDGYHYGVIRAVCEAFAEVHREGRIWWTTMDPEVH